MAAATTECIHCASTLVRYAHWGICPQCEPEFLARLNPIPEGYVLVPKVIPDERGRPWRNGKPV